MLGREIMQGCYYCPQPSMLKFKSSFSKNSPSWSGEYCLFFKDDGVKLCISPIFLIFEDQLILFGKLLKVITVAETTFELGIYQITHIWKKAKKNSDLVRVEIMPKNGMKRCEIIIQRLCELT